MSRLQRMNAEYNHSANFAVNAVSTRRSVRILLKRTGLIFLVISTFLASLYLPLPVSHAQHHYSHYKKFEPYVEYINEFTERRRLKTYFANEQSVFYGAQVGHVNVGRGNLTFIRRDMVAVGRIPLVFARVYDSSFNAGNDFGKGWHLSSAETIKAEPDRSLTLMTESATPVRFIASGNSFTQAKPCPTDIISFRQVDPKRIQIILRTGFSKEYKLIGDLYRLTRVEDRNGNSVILEYRAEKLARIRGQNKRFINIERGKAGRITSIKDDSGRRVSYEYNENGQLRKVVDLGSNHWRYEYNETGQLSRAVNPIGHTDMTVTYDEQGRVAVLQGSGLNYRYQYETGQTTVIDGNDYVSEFAQNGDGITTAITNMLGVKTSLTLDKKNNVERLYRNGTLQAEMSYDSDKRLASLTKYDKQGQTNINYMYDAAGQLAEIRTAGDLMTLRYDKRGNLLEKINRISSTRYSYSPTGDLLMMNFGDAIVLNFEVDADGQITLVKDKQNQQTHFKYDVVGKISRAQFADGSTRVYHYDRLGLRHLRRLDGTARVAYEYNASGSMSKIVVTNEDGTTDGQQLALDEEQKVRTIDRLTGGKSYLTYDGMGNLTSVTREDGTLRFNYDRYNRLTEVVKLSGERLGYSYTDGEPDLRLQMDHHTGQAISGRMDSGLTFSSGLELLRNRTQGSILGAVRFDRSMNDYRLSSEFGVILPDTAQNNAIMRMRIIVTGGTTYGYQASFDAPSNVMFIPAEYWAVNCCPQVCPPRTEGADVATDAITCSPCEPTPIVVETVELYYKYSTERGFTGPDNTPMKECIYNDCPSNTGKRCAGSSGFSDFRPASSTCPTGILLVSEYTGSFLGLFPRCKIINHNDFFTPFTCP